MRDAALQAAGPHDQTHERAEDRALRVGSSGRWSMRPPTEAALLLAAYIADDARYALNKFCKPTVVFERIEFAFFLLIIPIIAKTLATPPYKNVFWMWHFVRLKRLSFLMIEHNTRLDCGVDLNQPLRGTSMRPKRKAAVSVRVQRRL